MKKSKLKNKNRNSTYDSHRKRNSQINNEHKFEGRAKQIICNAEIRQKI